MKKYSIVISLFAMLLTACDPTVEEEGSIAASMTEAQLEQAATLMQTVEVKTNLHTLQIHPRPYRYLIPQEIS